MATPDPKNHAGATANANPRSIRAVVLFLFFVTGGCGLIYQIVWTRMLRLVLGNTTHTITTVLIAFMAGMALGSRFGGRLAQQRNDPLRIFALIQIGIAAYCLVLPWMVDAALPIYRFLYQGTQAQPELLSAAKFILCCLLVMIPSTLMGATLPVLSSFFTRAPERLGAAVGGLYAVNTFGAVVGTVSAGFFLIPSLGVRMTIYAACGMSLVAAVASYALHNRVSTSESGGVSSPKPTADRLDIGAKIILGGYALAGAAGMIYEIAWTRVISLLVGSSVYAFSMMLTAFILGLALGSAAVSRFVDRMSRPLRTLAIIEILIGLTALTVLPFIDTLPFHVTGWLSRSGGAFWQRQLLQFAVMLGIMIVPTFLMGAAFPLVTRLIASKSKCAPRAVGTVYCWNTLGCIAGSATAGFILIPWLGLQQTLFTAVRINVVIGCGFLLLARQTKLAWRLSIAAVSMSIVVISIAKTPPWDPSRMSFGPLVKADRYDAETARDVEGLRTRSSGTKILYHREGPVTTVTVKAEGGHRFLVINGKPDASTASDMPTQELLAHVPMLLHPNPRKVMVIGLASGVTLGSAGLYNPETLDCAEISPTVVEACRYFDRWNYQILDNPAVNVIVTDGRNHLALTDRKYDVIISEPPNPWVAGVSDLFTLEFYRNCRRRLNDGGIVCAFLEAYNIGDRDFRSVLATFQSVFPNAMLWRTQGSDFLLTGSTGDISADHAMLSRRMAEPMIASDLKRVGVNSICDLFSVMLMDSSTVKQFAGKAPIHTDDNALLEFSTPRILVNNPGEYKLAEAIERRRHIDLSFLTGPNSQELAEIKKTIRSFNAARGSVFLASALDNQNRYEDAAVEYRKAVAVNRRDAELRKMLRRLLARSAQAGEQGDLDAASGLAAYVCKIDPQYAEAQDVLGQLLVKKELFRSAFDRFARAVACDGKKLMHRLRLAGMAMKLNRFAVAREQYEKSLEINGNCVITANNLSFILSCCPDEKLRDGPRAVELAEKAAELTKRNDAGVLQTLSSAYANEGRFDEALTTARQAVVLAESRDKLKLAENIRKRMELYSAGKPYRHAPRPSP